jgi:hypothetical protein
MCGQLPKALGEARAISVSYSNPGGGARDSDGALPA